MDTTTNRVKLNRLLHKHVPGLHFSGLKREYDDMLECATKAKDIFRKAFLAGSTGAKALEARRRGLGRTAGMVECALQHAREYKFRLGEQLELIDELLDEFDGKQVIDLDSDNFECGRED